MVETLEESFSDSEERSVDEKESRNYKGPGFGTIFVMGLISFGIFIGSEYINSKYKIHLIDRTIALLSGESYSDFQRGMIEGIKQHNDKAREEITNNFFKYYDSNGDGMISREEYKSKRKVD